jgi:YidC/Oxa1 family membrane protein insertase
MLWRDWKSYRAFQKLPPHERSIVFYSETRQDWHHLQPLIDFLIERLSRTVCHITSEPDAPLTPAPGLHAFRVRSVAACTWLFQMLKADVMVLTMLDLQNFHLKRSIHPVRYVYVFHSMGSTHMVDLENSYDHYDHLFCTGPHQIAEIRRREELKGLPPKHLFAYGYPRLEGLARLAADRPREPSPPVTALLAPTWGEQSILHVCGERLIAALLQAGMRVILRPHYQTARLAPDVVRRLVARFGSDRRFRHVDRMGESASLLESDFLICDWSGMAIEYGLGLGKPVLFVDVPPRVRNAKYRELGLEPMEMRIRRELGAVLPVDRVDDAPRHAAALLGDAAELRKRHAALREDWVFNFGRSVEAGAREIARIADERAGAGASGAASRVELRPRG